MKYNMYLRLLDNAVKLEVEKLIGSDVSYELKHIFKIIMSGVLISDDLET